MANDSSTGGPLISNAVPRPLNGQALYRFLQELVVGITGLQGSLVRPRWQAEPANLPPQGTAWCAIGVVSRRADLFSYIDHEPTIPADRQFRTEELDLLCSFFDTGVNGEAEEYATRLREGLQIPQNLEKLTLANMGFVGTGELTPAPVLIKEQWQYRIDLMVTLRRQLRLDYPVLNLESAEPGLKAETELSVLTVPIVVTNNP